MPDLTLIALVAFVSGFVVGGALVFVFKRGRTHA